MLQKRFIHLILTRFNVKIAGGNGRGREWLEHRFDLFERFCLPSVCAQSCQNFRWLVFFDAGLPCDLRARVAGYARMCHFIPVYVPEYFTQVSAQRAVLPLLAPYEYLITTRLDNDDALARSYIEAVQSRFCRQEKEFINLPHGFIIEGDAVYAWSHFCNSFISLIERREGFLTVLCGSHPVLWRIAPVQQVEEVPGWLQAVHGRNLANTVKGTRVAGPDWARYFDLPWARTPCLDAGWGGVQSLKAILKGSLLSESECKSLCSDAFSSIAGGSVV